MCGQRSYIYVPQTLRASRSAFTSVTASRIGDASSCGLDDRRTNDYSLAKWRISNKFNDALQIGYRQTRLNSAQQKQKTFYGFFFFTSLVIDLTSL